MLPIKLKTIRIATVALQNLLVYFQLQSNENATLLIISISKLKMLQIMSLQLHAFEK